MAHRFLLDQNFPPPLVHVPDRRVEYVELIAFDRDLARISTPDWMIYLAAQQGGFTGVVTRDRSQLDQDAERVALAHTRLSVVTWRKKIDDPIAQWGHLLAYMPRILALIEREGPQVVTLPGIAIDASHHDKADAFLRRGASVRATTMGELRAQSLAVMRQELKRRKRADLAALLERSR